MVVIEAPAPAGPSRARRAAAEGRIRAPLPSLVAGALLLALLPPARAHDPGLSALEVKVDGDRLRAVLSIATPDIAKLPGVTGTSLDALAALAPRAVEVLADGRRLEPVSTDAIPEPGGAIRMRLKYEGVTGSRLRIRSPLLSELPRGHRQYLQVLDSKGWIVLERVLDASSPEAEVTLGEKADVTIGGFWWLGVEHILTGYDHLVFLLGLLLAARRFRDVALVVTSFSVAHSITLALSVLDLVRLSPNVVEPAIAASIAWVGVENLLKGEPRHRWLLAFGFGLIHGFGFASVLREMGLGSGPRGVAGPLLLFNVGVECGQVGIAAAVLPVIVWLRRLPAWNRWIARAASAGVAVMGAVWLVTRLWEVVQG